MPSCLKGSLQLKQDSTGMWLPHTPLRTPHDSAFTNKASIVEGSKTIALRDGFSYVVTVTTPPPYHLPSLCYTPPPPALPQWSCIHSFIFEWLSLREGKRKKRKVCFMCLSWMQKATGFKQDNDTHTEPSYVFLLRHQVYLQNYTIHASLWHSSFLLMLKSVNSILATVTLTWFFESSEHWWDISLFNFGILSPCASLSYQCTYSLSYLVCVSLAHCFVDCFGVVFRASSLLDCWPRCSAPLTPAMGHVICCWITVESPLRLIVNHFKQSQC